MLGELEPPSWKQILFRLLESLLNTMKSFISCMEKMEYSISQLTVSIKSFCEINNHLMEEKERLRIWEDNLKQREEILNDKFFNTDRLTNGAESPRPDPYGNEAKPNCLSRHLSDAEIEILKVTTDSIHKKYNIGTSHNLIFLMIVMRDLGYLTEKVGYTSFVRLLIEWEILPFLNENKIHSVTSGMSREAEHLPKRGKIKYTSDAWNDLWCIKDKEFCITLALEYNNKKY